MILASEAQLLTQNVISSMYISDRVKRRIERHIKWSANRGREEVEVHFFMPFRSYEYKTAYTNLIADFLQTKGYKVHSSGYKSYVSISWYSK